MKTPPYFILPPRRPQLAPYSRSTHRRPWRLMMFGPNDREQQIAAFDREGDARHVLALMIQHWHRTHQQENPLCR